jgi:hypothetical protein
MMNMDLSRVMNAYRGQEDKLKQRVQLSNDLLELIAYEQLTREKRQLMAAQQAQSGPPPDAPTIKEQKEKEALELTKQQLAQQIGGGLQQKAMQQQQAMRQGIAAAPGAQSAMPPQAMAAGGIVAFDDGGPVAIRQDRVFPTAPDGVGGVANTLSAISKMGDAEVVMTATKLTGMQFDSPTQARMTLKQMFGDSTLSAGISGLGDRIPNRLAGYSLGASTPAMGGRVSAGVDIPRGQGSPSFNLGYSRQFADGGAVGYQEGGVISPEEIAQRLRGGEGLISLRRSFLGDAPQSRNPQALIAWNERKNQFDAAVRQAQDLMRSGAPIAAPAAVDSAAAPTEPAAPVRAMPTRAAAPAPSRAQPSRMQYAGPDEYFAPNLGAQRAPDSEAPPAPAAPPAPVQTAISKEDQTGILAALPTAPDTRTSDRLATLMGAQLFDARSARANPLLQELTGLRGQLEQYAKEFPKESEESKRARAADQAALEARYAQMSDPQTQMLDRLQAFLSGGAGRRGLGSVLGGAGEASSRVRAQQQEQGLKALKDIQTGREAIRQRDITEAREAFGVRGKTLELGSKIAEVASKIEAETNVADQRVAASLAETAIRAYTQHQGDMEKIKADIAKEAALRRYNISNDELTRITQIAVAEIGAGARSDAATQSKIATLTNQRATQLNDIRTREEKAKEDPMLRAAMNAEPNKRTPAQQRMVNDHERKWAEERANLIGPIDQELARLRGQASAGTTAPTGSAAAQGVRVTGATPTR